MKTLATLLLALAVGLSALTPAQGHRIGPQGRQQVAGRGQHREMMAAMALCANALDAMRSALPIYQGHRVKAMVATRDAIGLIRQGLQFARDNKGTASAGLPPIPMSDNEPLGRFTREQVQRSNARMAMAARMLNQARQRLETAGDDYGGFRNQAHGKVLDALREIDVALALFRGDNPGNGRRP